MGFTRNFCEIRKGTEIFSGSKFSLNSDGIEVEQKVKGSGMAFAANTKYESKVSLPKCQSRVKVNMTNKCSHLIEKNLSGDSAPNPDWSAESQIRGRHENIITNRVQYGMLNRSTRKCVTNKREYSNRRCWTLLKSVSRVRVKLLKWFIKSRLEDWIVHQWCWYFFETKTK